MIKINSIVSHSDPGPRPNQEDYVYNTVDNSSRIFVLCDGMGGHGHGEVASQTVATSVAEYLTQLNPVEYTADHIQSAVDFAMQKLQEANTFDDEKPMGTTLVVVAINKNNVLVGHIGDSRCYQFDADGIKKFRTKDHSKVQEAVDAEILSEEEAWSSPKKNILTRCMLSSYNNVKVDVDTLYIVDKDILLLCSDGVTDALRDSQLQSIIIGRNPDECAEAINAECSLSSRDNFSYIIISVSQDEPEYRQATNTAKSVSGTETKPIHKSGGYCIQCGSEISATSKFCPVCGAAINGDTPEIIPKKVQNSLYANLKKWLSDINPFWLIAGGAVVGGAIVAFATCGNSQSVPVSLIEKSSAEGSTGGTLPEHLVSDFLTNLCKIDTINGSADTVVAKTDVLSQYQDFLDEFHKK